MGNITFLGSSIFHLLLENRIPVIHHLGFAHPPYLLKEYPNHPLYHLATASHYVRDRLVAQHFPVQDSITVYPSALVKAFYQPTLPPRDRLRIGYAGLVIYTKGVHVLINALHFLNQQGIDFECAIAGDAIYPDYKQDLDRAIEKGNLGDKIRFVGLLNREQLIQFHQQHNVLVFPSIAEEAFGITQVEAMAAGLTLITSGIGGAGEVIEHGVSGLQVPPEDAVALSQALAFLVQNPDQWGAIAQRGQQHAMEKFDIKHSVAQLEIQFQRLIDRQIDRQIDRPIDRLSDTAQSLAAAGHSTLTLPPYPPSSRFMTWLIDQLTSCLKVYQHSPQDESTISILREMRKQVTQFWLSAPGDALSTLYSGPLGVAYQQFLHSNFQSVPLTADEQQTLVKLSETIKQGVEQSGGVNALLGAMLYFPADKMQVRDAETRLPQWLLPDYRQRFGAAVPADAAPAAAAPMTTTPATTPTMPPTMTPGATSGTPGQTLWDAEFLNKVVGCANLYKVNPTDVNVVNRCREVRQAIAGMWIQIPREQLESVYRGEFGQHYLAFLKSGFYNEPLLEPEESCLRELSDAVKQGFESTHGLQALLGAMLYLPPGKMQVRDAATRLPTWLLSDYQAIFEGAQPSAPQPSAPQPQTPQPQTPQPPASQPQVVPPEQVHLSATPVPSHEDVAFLNRLLGCLNLYEIDPSDGAVVNHLRELRQQVAQIWLQVEPQNLESVFASEFGKRYCVFLKSGFQRELQNDAERMLRQQLSTQIGTGVEKPPGLKALLGAMLFFEPGSMKVNNAEQRLPQWLFPYYESVFEEVA